MTDWTKILEKADDWRHFPAYRMEPRVDLFFAIFLEDVLKNTFSGCKEECFSVIPEFPIKNQNGNLARVDFAVFGKKQKKLFLVELKTDVSSIDCKQLKQMITNAPKLLTDVLDIAVAANGGKYARKYAHLMQKLGTIGCICLCDEFKKMNMAARTPGLSKHLSRDCITVNAEWTQSEIVELVLIAPKFGKKEKCPKEYESFTLICFDKFAKSIEDEDVSSLGNKFAYYLREWARVEAGWQDLEGKNECAQKA